MIEFKMKLLQMITGLKQQQKKTLLVNVDDNFYFLKHPSLPRNWYKINI